MKLHCGSKLPNTLWQGVRALTEQLKRVVAKPCAAAPMRFVRALPPGQQPAPEILTAPWYRDIKQRGDPCKAKSIASNPRCSRPAADPSDPSVRAGDSELPRGPGPRGASLGLQGRGWYLALLKTVPGN